MTDDLCYFFTLNPALKTLKCFDDAFVAVFSFP